MNGTLYSVVITNIGSDTVEYLCETNSAYDWVEFQAGLEADQSFCYHEKNGWSDFSKTSPSACARIKAHTRTLGNAVNVTRPASFQKNLRRRVSEGGDSLLVGYFLDRYEGSAGNYVYIQDPCVQYGERYCKIFRLYRGSCG